MKNDSLELSTVNRKIPRSLVQSSKALTTGSLQRHPLPADSLQTLARPAHQQSRSASFPVPLSLRQLHPDWPQESPTCGLSFGISLSPQPGMQLTSFPLAHAQPLWGLTWWLRGQRICLQCGRPGLDPWVRKIPWRRAWQPTPGF